MTILNAKKLAFVTASAVSSAMIEYDIRFVFANGNLWFDHKLPYYYKVQRRRTGLAAKAVCFFSPRVSSTDFRAKGLQFCGNVGEKPKSYTKRENILAHTVTSLKDPVPNLCLHLRDTILLQAWLYQHANCERVWKRKHLPVLVLERNKTVFFKLCNNTYPLF